MGIGINVGKNQDYSYLFQSLSSGSGGMGNLNFLSDYASIKNGSYAKLMKTYYGTAQSSSAAASKKSSSGNILDKILDEKKNPKVSKEAQEANANLTTGLSSLKSSVAALQKDGTYTDTANGKSAADKVVSAMKAFVSDYNNVVSAAKNSTLANKTAYVANMMNSTATNADKLAEIGVSINGNGTLELNEAKLKEAGVSKVQDLFSSDNIMSYGSMIASRLRFAGAAASTNTADNKDTETTAASGAAGVKADGRALAGDALYEMVKDKDGSEKYDVDKIFATAKSFVNNYNKMFDTAESSYNSGVLSNLSRIKERTARSASALEQFGISVDNKGRMKIDEDIFKKADMSSVQAFFKDYGSSIATNASLVDYYMTTQANAANGYTSDGTYNVQGSARYADYM
ncbi:MAG: hypothetical protein HFI96_08915 [Lachnospiraceae bacterium]|nr:hypothetical protein [Lachnospiraceae bacterium]